MKIGGIDPATLSKELVLVLPRGDGEIVFKAVGLPDMEEFERLCQMPEAPKKLVKGATVVDTDNVGYKDAVNTYWKRRQAYIVVASLVEMEWDTVKLDSPSTWENWIPDLKAAGITETERDRVCGLIAEANCLNEAKLEAARAGFLAGRLAG